MIDPPPIASNAGGGGSLEAGRPAIPLAVVVIRLIGGAALETCVEALLLQGAEVIVVASARDPLQRERLGRAHVIMSDDRGSVPQRRLAGMLAANAPIIAFIEDTCLPGPRWCSSMCVAFEENHVLAAGGPVHIASGLPPQLRALAVSEYAKFSPAMIPGSLKAVNVRSLPGANFAVRHTAFFIEEFRVNGLVDNQVFDAINTSGGRMVLHRDAYVNYEAASWKDAQLSTRFHHGRIFGGLRAADEPVAMRLTLALAALGAPAVLVIRNLRDAGPLLFRSPATLLWTILLQIAWGLGECVGKLTGSVGKSMQRWA